MRYAEQYPAIDMGLVASFLARVEFSGTCWKWLGRLAKSQKGTVCGGLFSAGGKMLPAHKIAWLIEHGSFPVAEAETDWLLFRNVCGDASCVNPDHWIPLLTAEDIFWQSVTIGNVGGCWGWNGSVEKGRLGYPKFKFNKKQFRGHRFSYELHHGPIPAGLNVLHTCDNPVCTNPDHLMAGTQLENVRQMIERGREAPIEKKRHIGSKHGRALVTEADIPVIRASQEPVKVLAARYSLSTSAIRSIQWRKNWKHVA